MGDECLCVKEELPEVFLRFLLRSTKSYESCVSLRLFCCCSTTVGENDAFVSEEADAEIP